MVIREINLEQVCGPTSKLPKHTLPEIAFAGKSNVGKSSLLNTLVNRKSFARTSAQPGKTQTINFYNINQAFYLVDLPGYGFTRAPEEERRRWGQMIERYLQSSRQLKAVFLLVDIRHDPSENDRIMYDWVVEMGYEPVIIATKADKIKRSQLAKQVKTIRTAFHLATDTQVIPFSAVTRQGREEIWQWVEAFCK